MYIHPVHDYAAPLSLELVEGVREAKFSSSAVKAKLCAKKGRMEVKKCKRRGRCEGKFMLHKMFRLYAFQPFLLPSGAFCFSRRNHAKNR
jgi:hypothetical protein